MKNIDIFAHPIKLHLNGQYEIKSAIGGCFTIMTMVAMFLYAWFNGNDIFYKKIPKTYQEKITMDKSNTIEFSKNQTFIYFQIFDGDKNFFIDPSILKLKMVLKYSKNSKLYKTKSIKLTECQKNHFPEYANENNKTKLLYNQIIEKRYICPEFDENISLYGSWIEQNLTYFQIIVYPCQNSTDGGICKSQEEIDNTIWNQRLYLSFYYPLLSVGLNDYYNPFSYSYREDYFYLPKTNNYKFYTYGIDLVYINTDWGFIKPDFSYEYAYNVALISTDTRNIKASDPYFFSIDITSTFSQNFYSRSYIKITDILSNCGGMFNAVGLFFIVLNSFFFKLEITKAMLNKLFVFKDPAKPLGQEYNTYKVYNKFLNEYDEIKNNDLNLKKDLQGEKLTEFQLYSNKKDKFEDSANKMNIHNQEINNIETENRNFIYDSKNTPKNPRYKYSNEAFKKSLLESSKKDSSHRRVKSKYSENESKYFKSDTNKDKDDSPSFSNTRGKDEADYLKDLKNLREISDNNRFSDTNKPKSKSKKSKNFKQVEATDSPIINNPDLKVNQKRNPSRESNPNLNEKSRTGMLKSNENINENKNNKIELVKFENLQIKENKKLVELPIPDINDHNFNEDEYHKRYFIELLRARSKRDNLRLSFCKQFKYNFCGCFYKKKHLKGYDSKLHYLIDEYSKRTEAYFDYLKLIKNYHETEILKEIILEEHQKDILEIIRRKTIEIPRNFDDIQEFSLDDTYAKSANFDKAVSIEASVQNLFEKYNKEKKYMKRKPLIKVNHNLVEYLRKME